MSDQPTAWGFYRGKSPMERERDSPSPDRGAVPAEPERTAEKCDDTCNPFTASCGAKFCTFEDLTQHEKTCPAAHGIALRPVAALGAGEPPQSEESRLWHRDMASLTTSPFQAGAGETPQSPICPICRNQLDYQGWTSVETNSRWICPSCSRCVQINPYKGAFIPRERRQALVRDVPEVDSTGGVVAVAAPPAVPQPQLERKHETRSRDDDRLGMTGPTSPVDSAHSGELPIPSEQAKPSGATTAAYAERNSPKAGSGSNPDESQSMKAALEWIVNIAHGVGKAGGTPEGGEWESALETGKSALVAALGAGETQEYHAGSNESSIPDGAERTAAHFGAGETPQPPTPTYPIPLNEEQEQAVRLWAVDDRLWTTQETVQFNLRTFARVILSKAVAAPPAVPQAEAELKARLDARYIERLNICPDHRDKANGRCVVCVAEERGRVEAQAALPAPHLDVQALIAKWREKAKHLRTISRDTVVETLVEQFAAGHEDCADELEAALQQPAQPDRTTPLADLEQRMRTQALRTSPIHADLLAFADELAGLLRTESQS